MPSLKSFKTFIEWLISGLCLLGAAALLMQQDGLAAAATLILGLGINPLLNVNNILKAGLSFIAVMVLLSRA